MKKVYSFENKSTLSEIYDTGFELSFVTCEPNLQQCHQWVLCKDFLIDVLWATFNNNDVEIYGFKFEPNNNPKVSTNELRLIVRDKTKKHETFERNIQKSVVFVNLVNEKLGFEPIKAERVEYHNQGDVSYVWLLTGDKSWIHASPMISMLALFLRIGIYYNNEKTYNKAIAALKNIKSNYDDDDNEPSLENDIQYLKKSRKLRLLIFKEGLKIFKPDPKHNYPNDIDVDSVHNSWGIVGARHCSKLKKIWNLDGIDIISKTKEEKIAILENAVKNIEPPENK